MLFIAQPTFMHMFKKVAKLEKKSLKDLNDDAEDGEPSENSENAGNIKEESLFIHSYNLEKEIDYVQKLRTQIGISKLLTTLILLDSPPPEYFI